MLKIARTVAVRRAMTAEEILKARHMAHAGASTMEIHDALGWNMSQAGAHHKLKRVGISTAGRWRKAHYGKETTLPNSDRFVDYTNYKPKGKE